MFKRTLLSVVLGLWLGSAAGAVLPNAADGLGDFKEAIRRVQSGQADLSDSAALKSSVVFDYLVAARLRRDLELRPSVELDSQIDSFLKQQAGEPVGRRLRADWLASLAQRQRWDWFIERSAQAADPRLICLRLSGRLALADTEGLSAQALLRWLLPVRQPAECNGIFLWLKDQNLLTPALAEERVRAVLATGNWRLAREFAADVPAPRAAALLKWTQLLQSPKLELTALLRQPDPDAEPGAVVAGFTRLSIIDARAALELLPPLLKQADLTAADRGQLRRAAALGAAYSRDPGAISAFRDVPESMLDASVREWRVRAALWAGDFRRAKVWIEQMPPALATQPRWRYWLARAVAKTSGPESAIPLFAELASLRDYHGYLSADQLQRTYVLNDRPLPDDPQIQARLAADPHVVRAQALFQCDLIEDAAAEWSAALGGADNPMKVQAALLASHWGWHEQTIGLLAQAGEWDDLQRRYPRPFVPEIAAASRLSRVPEDWILAVMRQESLFRKDAVSQSGARGLMQLLPATALEVARRWRLPRPQGEALFDAATASVLGAARLRELLDRYDGQLQLSLAAYNAGPAPVARWAPAQPMDADIWIENIPYPETRTYVQRILEHIVAYAWVRQAEPPRLSALMHPVQAR